MPKEFPRSRRVAEQVHRVLSELLLDGVKDPGARGVSITHVEVSHDLGVAKVYFSLLEPDADPGPAQRALSRAAGYLRRELGRSLTTRRTPELRFYHDESIREGAQMSRLLEQLNRER